MTEDLQAFINLSKRMADLSCERVKKANEEFDKHMKKIRALL